jgi:hypothetical protein
VKRLRQIEHPKDSVLQPCLLMADVGGHPIVVPQTPGLARSNGDAAPRSGQATR